MEWSQGTGIVHRPLRVIGDRIGYEFAHQPGEIDPDVHAIRQPDRE